MVYVYLGVLALLLLVTAITGHLFVLWATALWLLPALLWAALPPPGRKGRAQR